MSARVRIELRETTGGWWDWTIWADDHRYKILGVNAFPRKTRKKAQRRAEKVARRILKHGHKDLVDPRTLVRDEYVYPREERA